jgi:prepilin-type N-terminal cleavage/methylation domain-containing protein
MARINKPANPKPMRSNNSSDKFARPRLRLARTCRAIAKRRRKRSNAPPLRTHAGFSLVEVLASLFVLTISAVGITAAWRLADYQELLTRADRRAERILRQYYELQTFAPPESRPFAANSSASPSAQAAITGYLYHPRLIAAQAGSSPFGNQIPFTISMTNGAAPGTNQLVLTYTIPSYGTQASRQVTKAEILNP